ncbi:MAG: hypothetical protein MH204_09745, partial [Fimbriimonadaceae bacterium]|nr:hypothetical protein [Fimbriimonadaceae bacterium]
MKTRFAAAAALLSLAGIASATELFFIGLADDTFTASVSTDPNSLGTVFIDQPGTWFGGPQPGFFTLTPGVVNYLNISARDIFGAPSMFIGSGELSDNDFFFNDGTQALRTNGGVNWTASLTGFGGAPVGVT